MVREQHPALVLLDTNLYHQEDIPRRTEQSLSLPKRVPIPAKQVSALAKQIKAQQPETRCLVLADNVHQQQAVTDAAGANGALLKGFSTAMLFAAIQQVLGET